MVLGGWRLTLRGKLGGPAHRQTVQKLAEMLRNDGYEVSTEVKVNTPLGAKGGRYVDVVGVKKRTGETKMYQVGDKTMDGYSGLKSKKALDDIQQETGVQPQFVDKGLGQRSQDIEDGITPSSPLMPGESESDTDVPEVPEIRKSTQYEANSYKIYMLPKDIEQVIAALVEKVHVAIMSPTASHPEPRGQNLRSRSTSVLPSEEATSVNCCLVAEKPGKIKYRNTLSQAINLARNMMIRRYMFPFLGCDVRWVQVLVRGGFFAQTKT